MLSDVAEAKVRALKEKSPARIEQTVRKIIDDVFREAMSASSRPKISTKFTRRLSEFFWVFIISVLNIRIRISRGIKRRE